MKQSADAGNNSTIVQAGRDVILKVNKCPPDIRLVRIKIDDDRKHGAKAAVLTRNEFAELSLCYFVRLVGMDKAVPLRSLARFYSQHVRPLLADISLRETSYLYIAAHSCGTFMTFAEGFTNLFRRQYAGILSAGFTDAQLGVSKDQVEWLRGSNLLIPCNNDPTKLQFNAVSVDQFQKAAKRGFTDADVNRLREVWQSTIWDGEDLIRRLESDFPEIKAVIKLWDGTMLSGLSLTAVGIAIGHANLARLSGFKADLGNWIQ